MSKRPACWNVISRVSCLLALSASLIACGGGSPELNPPGQPDEGYYRTFVWFATDRDTSMESSRLVVHENRGTGELSYGKVQVSIPDSHHIGNIESPSWYRVLARKDPSDFVLVLSIDLYEGRSQLSSEIRSAVDDGASDEALIFIHGFHVSFDEAAKRTAQLAYDLQFPGIPILYSWPSQGGVLDYPADEATVQWTRPHLEEFLQFVVTDLHLSRVHVVVHSMGNRALLGALADLDPPSTEEGAATLDQVVLAAPDIDADVFRELAEQFRGKAERYTLYTSANDKAIELSHSIHSYPRAGGTIVVVDGVDTIDASKVETTFLDHSYFGDSILSDIYSLVRNGLPPESRFRLRAQPSEEGTYWVFEPGPN